MSEQEWREAIVTATVGDVNPGPHSDDHLFNARCALCCGDVDAILGVLAPLREREWQQARQEALREVRDAYRSKGEIAFESWLFGRAAAGGVS